MTYIEAYSGRTDTVIENITTDRTDALRFDEIDFEPYGNPAVAVDTSARFAVHEILGGTTLRQKLGEDPREISIQGVCTEDVAQQINQLRRAKLASLNAEAIGEVIRCQVASTSVDPMEPGGAADMDGGDFLYSYSINLVEVNRR